jgi:hypothetical protein
VSGEVGPAERAVGVLQRHVEQVALQVVEAGIDVPSIRPVRRAGSLGVHRKRIDGHVSS